MGAGSATTAGQFSFVFEAGSHPVALSDLELARKADQGGLKHKAPPLGCYFKVFIHRQSPGAQQDLCFSSVAYTLKQYISNTNFALWS